MTFETKLKAYQTVTEDYEIARLTTMKWEDIAFAMYDICDLDFVSDTNDPDARYEYGAHRIAAHALEYFCNLDEYATKDITVSLILNDIKIIVNLFPDLIFSDLDSVYFRIFTSLLGDDMEKSFKNRLKSYILSDWVEID